MGVWSLFSAAVMGVGGENCEARDDTERRSCRPVVAGAVHGWPAQLSAGKVGLLPTKSPMSNAITELARRAGLALQQTHSTVATAESCTGGGIAEAITRIAGSSTWFERGWVTYSNLAKQQELGVEAALIESCGAVSEAVVRTMAEEARRRSGASWAIAVSGVAGPGGGSSEKPVGMVWLAWSGPRGTLARCRLFPGDRAAVRQATVEEALKGLLDQIGLA